LLARRQPEAGADIGLSGGATRPAADVVDKCRKPDAP